MFYLAIGLFFAAYVAIISERIHRTTVAIAGGVLMILLGVVNQEVAFESIDFNTIGLLIGMMIIVLIAKKTGIFQYAAIQAARAAKGEPVLIMIYLSLITAAFSTLLPNVTTILLIAPVTFVIANNLKINPIPLLIAEVIMSNIGGTATLIGDPPNILIGSAAGLSFLDFLVHLTPAVVLMTPVVVVFLKMYYRSQLKTTPELKKSIMQLDARSAIKDKPLLIKTAISLGLTVLGFLIHNFIGLEAATVALFGAGLLLIITDTHPEEILAELEWTTIFFFAGLFVLVAGIEHVGFIDILAEQLLKLTGGSELTLVFSLLWGSALFSAFIDNIPYVATMIPLIEQVGAAGIPIDVIWWALALGACIGGNGTLIGSAANLVAAGIAEKSGYKMTFKDFIKVGGISVVICMVISSGYIWVRYYMF